MWTWKNSSAIAPRARAAGRRGPARPTILTPRRSGRSTPRSRCTPCRCSRRARRRKPRRSPTRRCSSARTGERLTRCSKSGSGKRAVPSPGRRRCLVCERCARRDKEPCRFPESSAIRSNRLGANVGALAADKLGAPLQWGTKDAPPEYFVLVGAVLTKGE